MKERGIRLNGELMDHEPITRGYTAYPYPVGARGLVFHINLEIGLLIERGEDAPTFPFRPFALLGAFLVPTLPCSARDARAAARGAARGRRQRVQRLALPPDQLRPGGHRRPRSSCRSWAPRVGRSTLFGIPLQQQWSYANSGDFAPTYYLQSDAPLYYYSFTDAVIASAYRSLSKDEQARFDPMITGFNPADMYAADHIRRVLHDLPRRVLRHRRVQHPQGVRLLQDRRAKPPA